MAHKISVIVPVYNVEKYIGRCVESLLCQTLKGIQIVFVDDASLDNSISIIKKLVSESHVSDIDVEIISHDTNKGLPAARNTGLESSDGEYIFHCDGDDFLEKNALELLYDTAKSNNADFVWCDWYLSFSQNERYMKQPYCDTPHQLVRSLLNGSMKYNVWNKLVKANIYYDHNIKFPVGYSMGEDMTMIKISLHTSKIAYCSMALYHYVRTNCASISYSMTTKNFDSLSHNVEDTLMYVQCHSMGEYNEDLEFFKLNVKFPYLITGDKSLYDFWNKLYVASNDYIFKNDAMSLRAKLIQWMALKRQYWFVRIHYWLLTRLYYGIILK